MKERSSNYELLRIIAMFMIVLSHCIYFGVVRVGQSDAYELWNTSNMLFKIVSAVSILGTIGVGIFFMISGYFNAHREKTSIKKVCLTTLFFATLTLIIIVITKVSGGGAALRFKWRADT